MPSVVQFCHNAYFIQVGHSSLVHIRLDVRHDTLLVSEPRLFHVRLHHSAIFLALAKHRFL